MDKSEKIINSSEEQFSDVKDNELFPENLKFYVNLIKLADFVYNGRKRMKEKGNQNNKIKEEKQSSVHTTAKEGGILRVSNVDNNLIDYVINTEEDVEEQVLDFFNKYKLIGCESKNDN